MRPYELLLRHGLTRVDAESAHRGALRGLRAAAPLAGALGPGTTARDPVVTLGTTFANRLGLAAGFDKNAEAVDALAALGFGHVEVGTVTAQPQPGNPRPRLFRLPADGAVVNRMGFNNDGAAAVAARLAERVRRRPRSAAGVVPVVGVNIGKSRVVPPEDAAAVRADYATSARLLAPYADYLVVNVSSPNTPGLRTLQAVADLKPLVGTVQQACAEAVVGRRVPLLVKIAPDLADEDVVAVAGLVTSAGLDGVVATNTTVGRAGLTSRPADVAAVGEGGLSGPPLADRSREVLALLREQLPATATVISVGGVDTPAEARARRRAGADLVQAYAGLVYGGPRWPARVARALQEPV